MPGEEETMELAGKMESLTNLLPGSRVVGHQAGAGAARRAQQPPPPLHPP